MQIANSGLLQTTLLSNWLLKPITHLKMEIRTRFLVCTLPITYRKANG